MAFSLLALVNAAKIGIKQAKDSLQLYYIW
jgi:hypothetical protein